MTKKSKANFRILSRILAYGLTCILIFSLVVLIITKRSHQDWGPLRVDLFILGLAAAAILLAWLFVEALEQQYMKRRWPFRFLESKAKNHSWLIYALLRRARSSPIVLSRGVHSAIERKPSENQGPSEATINLDRPEAPRQRSKPVFILLISILVIEMTYVLIISFGNWTEWPETTQYYDLLAQSFLHGQVALPVEPVTSLEDLENPYDPFERQGIPILYDASYFEGNFYLYWGPVPAALIALWKGLTGSSVGDEQIVFISVNVIFIFSLLILAHIKHMYFQDLPNWLFGLSSLIVGTTHPMLWVLNWADIYPAAISCGQAWFIAGLYFAIPVLEGKRQQPWRLLVIGVLWGLAIGARLTLVLSIIFLCLLMIFLFYSKGIRSDSRVRVLAKVGLLLSPLLFSMVTLGLYNYARFGNVFETGLQFQLSKLNHKYLFEQGLMFNINYVLPNAAYYLLAPMRYQPSFPFIRPLFGTLPTFSTVTQALQTPEGHMVQNATGLLFFMPTIYYLGLYAWSRFQVIGFVSGNNISPSLDSWEATNGGQVARFILILSTSAMLAVLPVFFYFWVANRFLLDLTPLLAMISSVSMWYVYRSNQITNIRMTFISFTMLLITVASYGISLLLSMTGAWSRLDDINPMFWNTMIEFFS